MLRQGLLCRASFYIETGVAQLVEQWSPKPKVESSILSTRATEEVQKNENKSIRTGNLQ